MSGYDIIEHRHRFATWAAGRAAGTSPKCRLKVKDCKDIIESIGLKEFIDSIDHLPSTNEIDKTHREWCTKAIEFAKRKNISGFTHGVAAKLINVYLKGIFICTDNYNDERVQALHPPVDRLLLMKLKEVYPEQFHNSFGVVMPVWSKFDRHQYEQTIKFIREVSDGKPLWMIEEYWEGHQPS